MVFIMLGVVMASMMSLQLNAMQYGIIGAHVAKQETFAGYANVMQGLEIPLLCSKTVECQTAAHHKVLKGIKHSKDLLMYGEKKNMVFTVVRKDNPNNQFRDLAVYIEYDGREFLATQRFGMYELCTELKNN